MNELGKALIVVGIVTLIVGIFLVSGFGKGWFGRLPGDINVSRENFSFHFPLVTCLIISVVISLLLWLFRRG